MAAFIAVFDKNAPAAGPVAIYVNVDTIETVQEDGQDTLLTLTSGREVRAAIDLASLRPQLGLERQ